MRLYANLRADWMCSCRIPYNINGSTSICTLSNFQSETIAFDPNKMHPLFNQRVHCIKIGVLAKINHLQWKRWQCRRSLFNLNTIHQSTYYQGASLSTNAQKSPSFHSPNHRYSLHPLTLAFSPIVSYTILKISMP